MNDLEPRPIIFGALSFLGMNVLVVVAGSLLLAGLHISVLSLGATILFLALDAGAAVLAGYVAARLAKSRQILHGACAAVTGGTLVLTKMFLWVGLAQPQVVGEDEIIGGLAFLVTFPLFSLVGSGFVLYRSKQIRP